MGEDWNMAFRGLRSVLTVGVVGLCVAIAADRVMARGGGHGGGHHGGHHGNHHHSHHHNHQHAHHHDHHHSHHGWGGGGWRGGWGGGWGGWGGGLGTHLGYGLAGYGLGAWGNPLGGWSNYGANQPISLPVNGNNYVANNTDGNTQGVANTPAAAELADNSTPVANPFAGSPQENQARPPIDQLASNDVTSGMEDPNEEEDTVDYRGAIYVSLPAKDAQLYLNGNLVQGEGNQRVLLTPEIENDNDHAEKFQLRTVWNDKGQQSEARRRRPGGGRWRHWRELHQAGGFAKALHFALRAAMGRRRRRDGRAGDRAAVRDEATPPQQEENAPSSRRTFEHARPASN